MERPVKQNFENKKNVLAPSKSTAYISNLPFSFTNCDLFKIFGKYGKIVRVTILRDRQTRKSRGVAFLQFGDQSSAWDCVRSVEGKEMFGRTLRANIAKDNGRASQFIRRREYPDKSRCYECGEEGHLSYACPLNLLGEREPPPKKRKKERKKEGEGRGGGGERESEQEEEEDEGENEALSLSAAIQYQQELREAEEFLQSPGDCLGGGRSKAGSEKIGKKLKQSAYFSDEDEVSD